jgi:hypothetical protein
MASKFFTDSEGEGVYAMSARPTLKWAVLLTSVASLALAFLFASMLYDGGNVPILLALIAICLLNAVGLLRMTAWARVTSTILLWLVILSAIARLSPKSVDQYVANGQAIPSVTYLVGTSLLLAVPCFVVLYIFRKHRDEFRRQWF